MSLVKLLSFLDTLGTLPQKRLSQNFLIDLNILRKILHLAQIVPGEGVLEIGPGPGLLTEALLKAGAHVLAIEKDPVFANALSRFQTQDQRLSILSADALECPLEDLCQKKGIQKSVSNLPYHITTPLLERLFACRIPSLILMVQKEVAQRLTAQPSTKDYSPLSLFAQFYSYPKQAFSVSSHCFYPKPRVDSTVIRCETQSPPIADPKPFFCLVRTAFQQRRKMLRSSLQAKGYAPSQIEEALLAIGTSPQARPEALSLDRWLCLFRELKNRVPCEKDV